MLYYNDLIKKLRENIDERAVLAPLSTNLNLSIQQKNSYNFLELKLLGKQYILIEPKNKISATNYIKQKAVLERQINKNIIFYVKNVTPYIKKELINKKIDFISNDGQFYILSAGLNIKEEIKKRQKASLHDKFTPYMQLVFLYMLYNGSEYNSKELVKELNLTEMTISRIMREFESIGLVTHEVKGKTGRKNIYIIKDKKEFYNVGKDFLIKPIKNTIYVKDVKISNIYKNGLTALSSLSEISDDKNKTYACYKTFYKNFKNDIIEREEAEDKCLPKIDFLIYDPKYLTKTSIVDPITMILSIKNKDERIEKEISRVMKGYKWYTE